MASGSEVEIKIAVRGTFMGKKVWVREIRKQTKSGHQTAILSTDYRSDLTVISAAMSNLLRERMSHPDEARSLLRAIYNAEGDILPEPTLFPGTNLRLVYELAS